jgi:hypothetical protein
MSPSSTSGPLFITGFKRSGTTLLGTIVDRHPEISIAIECFFIPRYHIGQVAFWPLAAEENRKRLAAAITAEPDSIRNGLDVDEARIAAETDPNVASVLDAVMLDWAASRGATRWGDKSPGFITKMDTLHRIFPEARYVHIVRDGRDVMLSVRHRWEREQNVQWIAREWAMAIDRARDFGTRHSDRYLEVRYESLLEDPEGVVREVAEFAGLTFDPRMLRSTSDDDLNPALATWGRVNEPIAKGNFQKWRTEASPEDIAAFEYVAGHRLAELGYPLSGSLPEPIDRVKIRAFLLLRILGERIAFVGRGLRFIWRLVRR